MRLVVVESYKPLSPRLGLDESHFAWCIVEFKAVTIASRFSESKFAHTACFVCVLFY